MYLFLSRGLKLTQQDKMDKLIEEYIIKWQLQIAGAVKVSGKNFLLPVIYNNLPAMLKINREDNENNAAAYYEYIGGQGAANLYLHDDKAILIERLETKPLLRDLPEEGQDNIACNIIAKVVTQLHSVMAEKTFNISNLKEKLKPLLEQENQRFLQAVNLAKELVENPLNEVVLHGDIHHENIMYSGRGWLAIDPKCFLGESTYDFANALCNPFIAPQLVHDAKRMNFCADIYAKAARVDKKRLLQFAFVHANLAAVWSLQDNDQQEDYWLKCADVAASLL